MVTNIRNMEDGSRYIVIKLINGKYLNAVFPKNFQATPSFDNRDHACIGWQNQPLCLFLVGAS